MEGHLAPQSGSPLDASVQDGLWSFQDYCFLYHALPFGPERQEPPHSVGGDLRNRLESLGIMLLRELLFLEYKEALRTWDCHDLEELQRAVASNNLTWCQATTNRYTYACFIINMLNVTLIWEPFPRDS